MQCTRDKKGVNEQSTDSEMEEKPLGDTAKPCTKEPYAGNPLVRVCGGGNEPLYPDGHMVEAVAEMNCTSLSSEVPAIG